MEQMKFRVNNPQHSEAIQRKLFEMGASWANMGKTPYMTSAKYLFLDKEDGANYLAYCDEDDTFEHCCHHREMLLFGGDFVPADGMIEVPPAEHLSYGKPPLGLKPRYVHERERRLEILGAMLRYEQAALDVPESWIEELRGLYYEKQRGT